MKASHICDSLRFSMSYRVALLTSCRPSTQPFVEAAAARSLLEFLKLDSDILLLILCGRLNAFG